jgi:hypothetical protein
MMPVQFHFTGSWTAEWLLEIRLGQRGGIRGQGERVVSEGEMTQREETGDEP